ncbi:MAG: HU family DNA-binding protein [Candidatus Igneacidithiobacillus chanchocoensis]
MRRWFSNLVRRSTLTKSEMIDHLAASADISKSKAAIVLSSLVDLAVTTVAKGEKFALPGVGIFERAYRPARTGHNVKTGEPISVPDKFAPKFKASKQFKDAMPPVPTRKAAEKKSSK